MSGSQDELPTGTKIEEFEILKTLGRGGFGITYLAKDHLLGRQIVLKEYMPENIAQRLNDGTIAALSETTAPTLEWGLDRFSTEAQTLAQFRHPAIVSVQRLIAGQSGTAFIVMDYLEGGNLEEKVLRDGPLDFATFKNVFSKLLDGCRAVHQVDILHRDIKPLNIMMVERNPVLIDFGAARQLARQKNGAVSRIFADGYSPLEQYATDQPQGDFTDIYALAATAHFALVGEDPAAAPARVAGQKMPALRDIVSDDIPDQLIKAIEWGLQIKAADRPQNIDEWLSAFPDLDEKQVVVERHVVTEVVTDGVSRRTLMLSGLTVAGVGIAGFGGYLITRPPGKKEPTNSAIDLEVASSRVLNELAEDSYAQIVSNGTFAYAVAHSGTGLGEARLTAYKFDRNLSLDQPIFTSPNQRAIGHAISLLPDGDVLVGGITDMRPDGQGSLDSNMLVVRIDPSGKQVWSKTFGKGSLTSFAMMDGNIAFAGEHPNRGQIDALTVIAPDGSTVFDAVEIGKKSDESIEKLVSGENGRFYSLNFRWRKNRTLTSTVILSLDLIDGEVIESKSYSDEDYFQTAGLDTSIPADFVRLGEDIFYVGALRETGKSFEEGAQLTSYIGRVDGSTGTPIWRKHRILPEEVDGERVALRTITIAHIDGDDVLLCGAHMLDTDQSKIVQLNGEGEVLNSIDIPSVDGGFQITDITADSQGVFAIGNEVVNGSTNLRIIVLNWA